MDLWENIMTADQRTERLPRWAQDIIHRQDRKIILLESYVKRCGKRIATLEDHVEQLAAVLRAIPDPRAQEAVRRYTFLVSRAPGGGPGAT